MRGCIFHAQRLCVADDLTPGARLPLSAAHCNYLGNVLRLVPGDSILVFNGRHGEWRAELAAEKRRGLALLVQEQLRPQAGGPDIDYLFAPLKRARIDYMVQKATEMGVARLRPVLTRHTAQSRVNLERMRANAIEAAEQCGILRLPELHAPERLETLIARWDAARTLIFCDENSAARDPLATLGGLRPGALALLVGPEGGFDAAERTLLSCKPFVVVLPLGPRILRADTAAVAALALVNAALGDWR
jgi:16S rRNA (uracil1498-N3)-methyltransferase